MHLLLLSNSRNPGSAYLEHALPLVQEFLGDRPRRLAFVPYAAVTLSYDDYVARVRNALAPLGHSIDSVHEDDPVEVLREADAVMVGGGNSFRLLERMQRVELLDRVRQRVRAGMPYLGWSAGANLACPTIRTTNDMPVILPADFDGLGLVPFQVNPHYTEQTLPDHGGESRDDRIAEFLVLNPGVRVVGLREGSILRREGAALTLAGPHPLVLFEAGAARRELAPDAPLDFLLR